MSSRRPRRRQGQAASPHGDRHAALPAAAVRPLIVALLIGLPTAGAPGASGGRDASLVGGFENSRSVASTVLPLAEPGGGLDAVRWTGRSERGSGGSSKAASSVPLTRPRVVARDRLAEVAYVSPIQATAHLLYADFLGTCLACTSTEAGHDQSKAEARGTRLASEPASEGQAPANGYSSGTLLALPSNPLVHLALDEWEGSTWARNGSSGGHARAALVDFVLIEPRLLHVMAGDARSDATAGGSKSDASTDTDGVSVVAGDGALRVVLLHSDSTTGGHGQAYLASVNGGTLPGSQPATDNPVVVNRVLSIGLLRADREGAEVGSARDGKSQPVVGLATVRHGAPDGEQSEPLR
jgi:hypothetical protein